LHLNCPTHAVQRTPQGWRIQTDSDTFDATDVVLTCPSTEQARLLQTTDPGLSSLVSEIVYTPIAVALMGYREADTAGPLDGFGYIAPQRSQRDALGVQWCSSIFPERAPPGFVLWRVLCGGMSRPDLLEWSDEFLLRILHEELEFTMGVRAAPVFTRLIRWPQAIPQYRIGHPARVSAIMTAAKAHPGLWLGGNAYHGVAMNDCTDQANQIATQIATRTV
jgi:oxygen-dependent protoporphyrinogen oxidase